MSGHQDGDGVAKFAIEIGLKPVVDVVAIHFLPGLPK
jgi:hypothetical protein